MSIPTMEGVIARTITTERISTRVLFSGPDDGIPVLFLHGNRSSATWCEELMVALPEGYRGIAPDQRGYGDAELDKKIDATRGMGDLCDDALALLDYLELDQVHVAGMSLGGSVIWWMLLAAPQRLASITLIAPGSPYGYGGTKDENGTPCWPDFAGSGSGLVNPTAIQLAKEGYRGLDNPFGLRAATRALVYKPPFIPEREEAYLSAALATHIGDQDWPADKSVSENWPYFGPGVWGADNGLSPKYAIDPQGLYIINPKPAILWVRGTEDLLVSDQGPADPATLGQMGLIPNYPGPEVYPPQPMLRQTRAVLDKYEASGGNYQEIVIEDTGHVPFLEKPEIFNRVFHDHIR